MIVRTEALFSFSACALQLTVADKYSGCQNRNTLHLQSYCQCTLFHCAIGDIRLGTRTLIKASYFSAVEITWTTWHMSELTVLKLFWQYGETQSFSISKH